MCHTLLQDPKLYALLSLIDHEHAAEVRAAGCGCGGVLHSARYPRKPRGGPPELRQTYNSRLSFCCAQCRRRHTPMSVRYLGRRVYLATVVVLACAMLTGITGRRASQLSATLNVPLRTLERWRHWWMVDFVKTPFWRSVFARFMPPVALATMPAGLLSRFTANDLASRLTQSLRFLAPLSTLTEAA